MGWMARKKMDRETIQEVVAIVRMGKGPTIGQMLWRQQKRNG